MDDLNGYLFDGTVDLGEISHSCDCCSKYLRYCVWLKHYKTGKKLLVGRECSNKCGIYCNNCNTIIHKVIKTPDGKYRCVLCNGIIEG